MIKVNDNTLFLTISVPDNSNKISITNPALKNHVVINDARITPSERAKLAGIESGATADQTLTSPDENIVLENGPDYEISLANSITLNNDLTAVDAFVDRVLVKDTSTGTLPPGVAAAVFYVGTDGKTYLKAKGSGDLTLRSSGNTRVISGPNGSTTIGDTQSIRVLSIGSSNGLVVRTYNGSNQGFSFNNDGVLSIGSSNPYKLPVNRTGASQGDVLKLDTDGETLIFGETLTDLSASTLADLSDVELTTPFPLGGSTSILAYNPVTSKWGWFGDSFSQSPIPGFTNTTFAESNNLATIPGIGFDSGNSSLSINSNVSYGLSGVNLFVDGGARIDGAIQVNDPSSTGYAFPTTDGTANQLLATDGSGAVTFVTPSTSNVTEGTNLYYTDARVAANSAVAANTAKTSFPGFGTTAGTALEGDTALFDGQYSSLTGVPSTFAPSAHTHTASEIADFDTEVSNNTDVAANTAKVGYTDAAVDLRIAAASIDDLDDVKIIGTPSEGDALVYQSGFFSLGTAGASTLGDLTDVNTTGAGVGSLIQFNGSSWDISASELPSDAVYYHNRYASEAETLLDGATATVELYYTAQADGDGLHEDAQTDTATSGYDIQRKLYYAEKAQADPDTSGDWTQFADIADDTTFASAKATLLAYLKERTGGTVPISLKMTWEEVAEAPSFTGLLNESYGSGAEAAYSTRRLNGNVTDCMVIRRASDSTTTTIGFDGSGNIDESAITTFCTGTTCTVVTWKDQSGNGNDATAAASGNEPTIYTGGALVKENGKVAVDFASNRLQANVSATLTAQTVAVVATTGSAASWQRILSQSTSSQEDSLNYIPVLRNSNTNLVTGRDGGNKGGLMPIIYDEQFLFSALNTGSALTNFLNGTSNTTTNYSFSESVDLLSLGNGTTTSDDRPLNGVIQEAVVYHSAKSTTDLNSIESNIGDYFTQNTPLLDTYTGAAAAYSLRKLRTAYTGDAVEVYNGSSYADIGFNVFGELDTVALAAHCGSNDGFVSKWYDQASTNDAAQTTTANMPKIYDGTTGVVTRGGKPSVLFTGSTQILPISTSFNNNTYLYVGEPLNRSQGFGASGKSVRTDGTIGYRNFGFEWAGGNLYVLHNDTVYDATSGGNISVTLGFDVVLFRRGSVGTITPDSIGRENTQYISEIVSYSTLESDSNLVGISNNANAFYSAF